MPEFQRGNSTAYMNSPPPLDPKATGYYAVSPPPKDWEEARVQSYFEEYNRHMLQILTIHEAYPGHYVQFEYANRHPSLIRKVLGSGTYIEGWAVYTEKTLLDQGYGAGDLALRLTQLKFYLRAGQRDPRPPDALRRITDEQAMELSVCAFQSEGESWPGSSARSRAPSSDALRRAWRTTTCDSGFSADGDALNLGVSRGRVAPAPCPSNIRGTRARPPELAATYTAEVAPRQGRRTAPPYRPEPPPRPRGGLGDMGSRLVHEPIHGPQALSAAVLCRFVVGRTDPGSMRIAVLQDALACRKPNT
jgi:hypothetical protein